MRTSKDFILDKLRLIFNSFEGIKIRYEFRDLLSAHLIEILPLKTFEENQEYILLEMKIQDEFEELFGNQEEILFLSSDSLNQIEKPFFTLGYGCEISDRIILIESMYSRFSDNDYTVDSTSYALAA